MGPHVFIQVAISGECFVTVFYKYKAFPKCGSCVASDCHIQIMFCDIHCKYVASPQCGSSCVYSGYHDQGMFCHSPCTHEASPQSGFSCVSSDCHIGRMFCHSLTHMRLLLSVSACVSLQITRNSECLVTDLTNIRFLSIVNPHVFLQVAIFR